MQVVHESDDEDVLVDSGLGFKEQKELLVLKQQHLMEVAKIKQQTEMAKLDVEYKKLELIQKGLLTSDALLSLNTERGGGPKFDISTNLPHLEVMGFQDVYLGLLVPYTQHRTEVGNQCW